MIFFRLHFALNFRRVDAALHYINIILIDQRTETKNINFITFFTAFLQEFFNLVFISCD